MNLNGKNILITGISGFVGSIMAETLLSKGANIYGLVRKRADEKTPYNIKKKKIENKIQVIKGDLTDPYSIASSLDIASPDIIFHLAAQSFVPRSMTHPIETHRNNSLGSMNLLEVIRKKEIDPVIVFAGSSEEYGMVINSEEQHNRLLGKYGNIFPEPTKIPELPINENNPFRPMSPYAVTKIYGEYLFRNYFMTYGLKTVVSRGFNHEGAGRGDVFVTSVITKQVASLEQGDKKEIEIGNVNAFRDWSHVKDIIDGYILLSEKGKYGNVYNQGSMRTNSVLTYILKSIESTGNKIKTISTIKGKKEVKNPTEENKSKIYSMSFEKTKIDDMLLNDEINFTIKDEGVNVITDKGKIIIKFNKNRFRPCDVPILLSDTQKIQKIGFSVNYSLQDICKDQLNYYLIKEKD